MELGPLIASGRTAEVFAYGDGRIVKLMRPGMPPELGEMEERAGAAIAAARLDAPRLLGTVRLDGRFGLVYERVDGPSMLEVLQRDPLRMPGLARAFADLHVQMHRTDGEGRGLPRLRESLATMIAGSPYVSAGLRAAASDRLARLTDGQSLLHYDFHPGNVLMTERGPRIIDWMSVQVGEPEADIARTIFLIRDTGRTPAISPLERDALAAGPRAFLRDYLRTYRRLAPLDARKVERWRPVILVGRLAEGIAEERPWLRQEAHRAFELNG